MKRSKPLPTLSSTGRRYLDRTRGARLQSPGIERFVSERRRAPWLLAVAALFAAALLAAMIWFSRGG